jgi:hypothetical protein
MNDVSFMLKPFLNPLATEAAATSLPQVFPSPFTASAIGVGGSCSSILLVGLGLVYYGALLGWLERCLSK